MESIPQALIGRYLKKENITYIKKIQLNRIFFIFFKF